MHEMALVHPIVDTVLAHATAIGAAEVAAVHLTIGDGRDVIEDYMHGLFAFLTRGTVAENAKLVIRHIPYTVKCNECDHVFPLNVRDKSTWTCPACDAERNYHLHSGMEFTIDSIEVARFADAAVA